MNQKIIVYYWEYPGSVDRAVSLPSRVRRFDSYQMHF